MLCYPHIDNGVDELKILCPHCSSELKIRTSKQVVAGVRDIYCNCDNELCLSRPVMQISHSHDLQKPIFRSSESAIAEAVRLWSSDDKLRLLKLLQSEMST